MKGAPIKNIKVKVVCPNCQKERAVFKSEVKNKNYTGWCLSCNALRNLVQLNSKQKKENHPRWHGGWTTSNGYIFVRIEETSPFYSMATTNSRILEHRLFMAESLGRCLETQEVVHHLNGTRTDNRLENLCLTNNSNHERKTLVKCLQQRIKELEDRYVFNS